ncbi:4-hydroxy-3-methylbut-2-enyl diphosphate reductase [Chloroflexota bacterium]
MKFEIEKAEKTGFCFGVRRAVNTLEKLAGSRGGVETLGAVVHNEQVLERLAKLGVRVAPDIPAITGDVIVTSSHGVTPETEETLKNRNLEVVSTTCPFVLRAQGAARRLAEAGFHVIVYGDRDHPEVTGILGWARGKGLATTTVAEVNRLTPLPRRLGILSQTTQVPAYFLDFVKGIIDSGFVKDSEIRIVDTICHDIRERQESALALARRVDLMLVIGGPKSANTKRLGELCAAVTRTHLIETAAGISPRWLDGVERVGVTSGASTPESVVEEVIERLAELTA